jgi:hypothetical protein
VRIKLHYPKTPAEFVNDGIVALGVFAAYAAGCYFTKKRLLDKYNEDLNQEISAIRAHYDKLYKKDVETLPAASVLEQPGGQEVVDQQRLQNAVDALNDYQPDEQEPLPRRYPSSIRQDVGEETEVERVARRVRDEKGRFTSADQVPDQEELRPNSRLIMPGKEDLEDIVAKLREDGAIQEPATPPGPVRHNIFSDPRPPIEEVMGVMEDVEGREAKEEDHEEDDPNKPRLITVDLFGEDGFATAEYTYYVGDKTLADDEDQPIPEGEVDERVGTENLEKFGYLEGEPSLILVRNPVRKVDYEIALHDESYGKAVAGFTNEGDDG